MTSSTDSDFNLQPADLDCVNSCNVQKSEQVNFRDTSKPISSHPTNNPHFANIFHQNLILLESFWKCDFRFVKIW